MDAHQFQEEVRKLDDKRKDTMRQVVEALRGDALNAVMEVGYQNLMGPDGPKKLVDTMAG